MTTIPEIIKQNEEELDAIIRDLTGVGYTSKSQARQQLIGLFMSAQSRLIKAIVEEIERMKKPEPTAMRNRDDVNLHFKGGLLGYNSALQDLKDFLEPKT